MITTSCTTFSTSSVLLVLFLAVSLVPSVVSSQPNCKEGAQAKIEQKGEVTLSAKVSWKPSTCNLVVQAYQGEQLVGEFGKEKGVRSGIDFHFAGDQRPGWKDRIEGLGAQLDEPLGRNVGYGSSEKRVFVEVSG